MTPLHPLRFHPLYRHYLWGGRRFGTLLGRSLEPGKPYAESWEIVDHGDDQSVVRFGPLAGASLGRLMIDRREEVLGSGTPGAFHTGVPLASRQCPQGQDARGTQSPLSRFPLLLKFLDAAEGLSLQVHPGDAIAARLDPPELGKTEAWFVLAAERGSRIGAGLGPGVDEKRLRQAIAEGAAAECVRWFEPAAGDAILIPAGTVHALGGGILVAEIQQASDATFRLFDWNRLEPDGKPRPLHVEQALAAIDFGAAPPEPVRAVAGKANAAVRILGCGRFIMSRWNLDRQATLGGDGRCHLATVLEGAVEVEGDPAGKPLARGQTILLPAVLGPVAFRPQPTATLLDVTVL